MAYLEAPDNSLALHGKMPSLFLAGGITGCKDWQSAVSTLIGDEQILTVNPRRAEWPENETAAVRQQIEWEHWWLRRCDAVLFWFPDGPVQPIALYELGCWSNTDKPMAVGADPTYVRRFDVKHQTRLVRPEQTVHSGLGATLAEAIEKVYDAYEENVKRGRYE